jgi:hypothetical protein
LSDFKHAWYFFWKYKACFLFVQGRPGAARKKDAPAYPERAAKGRPYRSSILVIGIKRAAGLPAPK